MAQIDPDLYNSIAASYALIDLNLSGISSYARTALNAIVDVTGSSYPDPSASTDAALEIELALLTPFNTAYNSAKSISNSVSSLLDAVRAINSHVINNTSGTGTATAKLQEWINTTMLTHWSGTNCPTGWANLSSDAGYDTSGWTTE